MSKTIKVSSSLILPRIDPVLILKRYLNGEYKNITLPSKVNIKNHNIKIGQKLTTDQNNEIFKMTDKTNTQQIIVTTNQSLYENNFEKKNWCLWSKREIKDSYVGIPISMTIDEINGKIIFETEGTYYNFSCAYAALKRMNSYGRMYRDILYMDSEQLLHCMYHTLYPENNNKRIVEAKDWRLLNINGGPLTEEEYDDESYEYIEIPNVIIKNMKKPYLKLKTVK